MNKRLLIGLELAANLFLPWLAYRLVEPTYGEFAALVASSVPPLLWSLGELIIHRRIDALSLIVLAGIVLSLFGMALGGDARLLLVRESLVSGLIGLAFLISLLLGRPLVFFLARATMLRQNGPEGASRFLDWSESTIARKGLAIMTLVWGLGLTTEAAMRTWLALSWTPEKFLAIAPPLGYAFTALLAGWTFWYTRKLRYKIRHTQTDAPLPASSPQ